MVKKLRYFPAILLAFSLILIVIGISVSAFSTPGPSTPAQEPPSPVSIDSVTTDTLAVVQQPVQATPTGNLALLSTLRPKPSLQSVLRGLLGLSLLVLAGWLCSTKRKSVNWRTVGGALLLQMVIAVLVIFWPPAQKAIEVMGHAFVKVLAFTAEGSRFVFGPLASQESFGFIFAFQILPTIVFFSALTSLLYYFGVIQFVVYLFAWVMTRLLRLSGAESLSATGNIFLGQTEAPLLIKGYLDRMTRSEILLVMVGGMATIAGGVLAMYIQYLGGGDPELMKVFAVHLITASVMAAPGAVVMSKLLLPETEPIDTSIHIPKEKIGSNILSAISNGTTDGLRLAVNVGGMLLVFLAFIALFNFLLLKIGDWTTLNLWVADISNGQYQHFSLQFILGYGLAPLMWVLGVDGKDIALVGQLLGEKIILNEFVAYTSLGKIMVVPGFANPKSIIIATYILCGFANFSSIGIQIGGIGALVPEKRKMLAELGFRALLGGGLASLLSATIVGMIYG
ncbi:MAG TPA: nucleoside transporter C-terminal domain-containing protein [Bacteroidales bacterium]|nr:nucleoside transporter C-terminal domain-containing protein [Bacteroidales bacterium]HRZ50257.1 nucleoside transporter C-terminal domain-containing protein [Bacteroidales bacterium]